MRLPLPLWVLVFSLALAAANAAETAVVSENCETYDILLDSPTPRWTTEKKNNLTVFKVSLDFLGEGAGWKNQAANRYLVSLSQAAEKLKGQSEGKFQFRMVLEKDNSIRIEMTGDATQIKKVEQAIQAGEIPPGDSTGLIMIPFNRLRFTQGTVGADKIEEKRTTANAPAPAYRLVNPKTGKSTIVILDGHHRSFSYLDPDAPDYQTLVPVKLLTVEEVNDYVNKKSGPGSPKWPKALIDLTVWDHMMPKGTIPTIEEDFDPNDRRR